MNFADRISTALYDNVLVEMSSFTLPEPILLPNQQGQIVPVKYLDMRWEDYRNPFLSKWGQWTPFVAELPAVDGQAKKYLVWDGAKASISTHDVQEFYTAPKKWWIMVQGMAENGDIVLKPKVMRKVEV
jgi:hypothetical protein